jgi:ATP:corrinoid adenosyltransferase
MMRVLGRGRKALMIQFIKGPWKSGEDEFALSSVIATKTKNFTLDFSKKFNTLKVVFDLPVLRSKLVENPVRR